MRFYYYATDVKDGTWTLHSSLESEPLRFPNKDAALAAARANCRKHWESYGTPCGVRIQAEEGSWIDQHVIGEEESSPSSPRTSKPDRGRRK